MPKSNMPKHAEQRNMPEGPHLCMQMTKRNMPKHVKHAGRPRGKKKHAGRTASATPATQNDGGCEFVPRLPRETTGGCQFVPRLPRKVPRRHGAQASPSAPPSAICATPATQNDGGCEFVPRLPRKRQWM